MAAATLTANLAAGQHDSTTDLQQRPTPWICTASLKPPSSLRTSSHCRRLHHDALISLHLRARTNQIGNLHQFTLEQWKTQPLPRATNVSQSTRTNLQRTQQRRETTMHLHRAGPPHRRPSRAWSHHETTAAIAAPLHYDGSRSACPCYSCIFALPEKKGAAVIAPCTYGSNKDRGSKP